MHTNHFINRFKPLTLAVLFALGATSAMAADNAAKDNSDASNDKTPYVTPAETNLNTDWMSATSAEFVKLDTTGNGLLLPYEASKDKAFNKKTFAKADVDKDGYIDLNEYTNFKAGKSPDEQAANTGAAKSESAAKQSAVTESNRSVGEIVDDSVITTKAKAKILATKQLKSLQISVETRDGEVLLSGEVDSVAAKTKAEQVVSQIAGVKSVKNNLEVKG